jgi:hypothetical protein
LTGDGAPADLCGDDVHIESLHQWRVELKTDGQNTGWYFTLTSCSHIHRHTCKVVGLSLRATKILLMIYASLKPVLLQKLDNELEAMCGTRLRNHTSPAGLWHFPSISYAYIHVGEYVCLDILLLIYYHWFIEFIMNLAIIYTI